MKKQNKFALSILTVSLFAATSAMATGNDSPFAPPLHLSNAGAMESRTVTSVEKNDLTAEWQKTNKDGSHWEKNVPNIMLYLDNSGSMLEDTNNCYSSYGGACNGTSKMSILKGVLKDLLNKERPDPSDPTKKLKYGQMANWGVTWLHRDGNGVALTDDYQEVLNSISKAVSGGQTPFLTGYLNAANKFANTPIDLRCTNNYIIAMTDGAANDDNYNDSSQLDNILQNSTIWQKVGVSNYTGRPAYRFENYAPNWPQSEVAQYLQQFSKPLLDKANIYTYTVAFALGDSPKGETTRYMLEKGASGEGQINGKKTYFKVKDGDGLTRAFEEMFDYFTDGYVDTSDKPVVTKGDPVVTPPSVKPGGTTVTISSEKNMHALAAPALSAENKLYPDELVALYLPVKDEGGLRSAELRFYQTKDKYQYNDKGLMTGMDKTESMDYQVPDFTLRQAVISNRYGQRSLMSSDAASIGFDNNTFQLNADTTGNEWKEAMMPWMSRSMKDLSIKALGYNSNTIYRDRGSYQMGDILESDIVTFRDENQKYAKFIVAAANDGMAYLFKKNPLATSDPSAHPFNLQMTYAPSALLRQNDDTLANHYKDIAHEEYAKTTDRPHLYMLSGGLISHTLNKPAHIDYVVGNAGRGARGLYGLNVSALETHAEKDWKDYVPLFDAGAHRDGLESDMGYTIGYPSTGRFGNGVVQSDGSLSLGTGIHVLSAVGSGFSTKTDLAKQETALYLYDTLGGADVGIHGDAQIDNDKAGRLISKTVIGNTGGLATPALVDINYDGVVDYAFAGDYSGNMYRCDMRFIDITDAKNKNQVSCEKIFEGSPNRPITSAPVLGQFGDEFVVAWGTGSDLFESELVEKKRQAVYGVYQTFDLKTLDIKEDTKTDTVAKESDLLVQEFKENGTLQTKQYRTVTNHPISKAGSGEKRSYKGWMLELNAENGERVVVQPILVSHTLYLATRIYNEKGEKTTGLSAKPWDDSWKPEDWEKNGWKADPSQTFEDATCSSEAIDQTTGKNGWSPAVLVKSEDPQSKHSSVGACNNSSGGSDNSKTDTFQSTCTEQKRTVTVVRPEADILQNYSALIQLYIKNGGAINPKEKKTSYVLMTADESQGSDHGFVGSGYIVSSESFKGFIALGLNNPSNKEYNRDKNANILPHGVDPDLDEHPIPPRDPQYFDRDNPCLPDEGKPKFQFHVSGTEKGLDTIDGFGDSPQINCLRRISWREIY